MQTIAHKTQLIYLSIEDADNIAKSGTRLDLASAKALYIAAAEAIVRVAERVKDDVNFQQTMSAKFNEIVYKVRQINMLTQALAQNQAR